MLQIERIETLKECVRRALDTLRVNSGYAANRDFKLPVVNGEAARRAKYCLAEYLVLDALIGNTDRHHENWGMLRKRRGERWTGFIAPSFDHASSLGRELLDVRRDRLLEENRVNKYAERGRGAVYWAEEERCAPSPLELVRTPGRHWPPSFRTPFASLCRDAARPSGLPLIYRGSMESESCPVWN